MYISLSVLTALTTQASINSVSSKRVPADMNRQRLNKKIKEV